MTRTERSWSGRPPTRPCCRSIMTRTIGVPPGVRLHVLERRFPAGEGALPGSQLTGPVLVPTGRPAVRGQQGEAGGVVDQVEVAVQVPANPGVGRLLGRATNSFRSSSVVLSIRTLSSCPERSGAHGGAARTHPSVDHDPPRSANAEECRHGVQAARPVRSQGVHRDPGNDGLRRHGVGEPGRPSRRRGRRGSRSTSASRPAST